MHLGRLVLREPPGVPGALAVPGTRGPGAGGVRLLLSRERGRVVLPSLRGPRSSAVLQLCTVFDTARALSRHSVAGLRHGSGPQPAPVGRAAGAGVQSPAPPSRRDAQTRGRKTVLLPAAPVPAPRA